VNVGNMREANKGCLVDCSESCCVHTCVCAIDSYLWSAKIRYDRCVEIVKRLMGNACEPCGEACAPRGMCEMKILA
jgi:hypothetical protein